MDDEPWVIFEFQECDCGVVIYQRNREDIRVEKGSWCVRSGPANGPIDKAILAGPYFKRRDSNVQLGNDIYGEGWLRDIAVLSIRSKKLIETSIFQ